MNQTDGSVLSSQKNPSELDRTEPYHPYLKTDVDREDGNQLVQRFRQSCPKGPHHLEQLVGSLKVAFVV